MKVRKELSEALKSKKDRQYKGQKKWKRTNNYPQLNIAQKI